MHMMYVKIIMQTWHIPCETMILVTLSIFCLWFSQRTSWTWAIVSPLWVFACFSFHGSSSSDGWPSL